MKKKMNLNSLSIESFVTSLEASGSKSLKGGNVPTGYSVCHNCDDDTGSGSGSGDPGPGGTNTGWPPSQGCSNNSCAICHEF